MHLWFRFYLSRPFFDQSQLDSLQSVINRVLPDWSNEMRVAEDEDSKDVIAIGPNDRLHTCLHRAAAPKRGLGSALLVGAHPGLSFYLDHCDKTLPPELNMVAIELYELATVEGQASSIWARKAFEEFAAQLPVRYGNVRTR